MNGFRRGVASGSMNGGGGMAYVEEEEVEEGGKEAK